MDFENPHLLTNPDSKTDNFADFIFVQTSEGPHHFVAISGGTHQFIFYEIDPTDGGLHKTQTLTVTPPDPNYEICHGSFLPTRNLDQEVYFLALCWGETDATYPGYIFGRAVSFLVYDTAATEPQWATSSTLLQHPFFERTPSTLPYVGTFADHIVVALDSFDSSSNPVQALYLSGSEYSASDPGGSVFWYVMANNSVDPVLTLNLNIKDAKLALNLHETPDYTPSYGDLFYYMHGFGANIALQTSPGYTPYLAVANHTDQDAVTTTCSTSSQWDSAAGVTGYVQLYRRDALLGWEQVTYAQCSNLSNVVYANRFIGAATGRLGFGYGLAVFRNYLLISGDQGAIQIYPIDIKWQPIPQNLPLVSETLTTSSFSMVPATTSDPVPPLRNIQLSIDDRGFILNSYQPTDKQVGLTLYPTVNDQYFQDAVTQAQQLFRTKNQGSDPDQQRRGYGEWYHRWSSLDGLTEYLIINDPLAQQAFLYSRSLTLN